MSTILIFITLFIGVSLLLIWLPHFRQQKLLKAEKADVRKQTNLAIFNHRLAALSEELEEKILDQAEFDALKQELEVSLLQDINQGDDESLVAKVAPKSGLWPTLMSAVVVAVSAYLYTTLGAYDDIDTPPQASPHAGMTQAQVMQMRIDNMEKQSAAEPENSQLLFSLGNMYISANRYTDAIRTFDQIMKLVGVHAELIGPKATAMYYQANQNITPAIQALIDQSLELDPNDPSTLLLVGMDSFVNANYAKAVDAWQTILDSERKDIDRSAIMNAIETAKMRMQAGGDTSSANTVDSTIQPQTQGIEGKVEVQVSIAPQYQENIDSSDMLFVFARNIQGPKVPLAVAKLSAKSLPTTIILDDNSSMGGDIKLSDTKVVEVIAVISKHGGVMAQTGDLTGSIAEAKVGESLQLVIDSLVK